MTYRSSPLPGTSSSAIAGAVTIIACTWFLLAIGAILADKHSETLVENVRAQVAEQAVVPDSRATIVVEAHRSGATL